ncbi:hypothetical protein [Solirubrobacter ginsenosidimutans]|nr:hypothetical protein [Solirubrobacter ginsenosidimutans]
MVRRAATTFGGVWVGLWAARIVGWIANVDGAVLVVVAVAFGFIGGLLGWAEARKRRPMASQERRDAVLGWGIVGLLVGVLAIIALAGTWD